MSAVEILAELVAVRELRIQWSRLKGRRDYRSLFADAEHKAKVDKMKTELDERWPKAWAAAEELLKREATNAPLPKDEKQPQVSYWQRGCDDAKADRPPMLNGQQVAPTAGWQATAALQGYAMGYRFGKGLL